MSLEPACPMDADEAYLTNSELRHVLTCLRPFVMVVDKLGERSSIFPLLNAWVTLVLLAMSVQICRIVDQQSLKSTKSVGFVPGVVPTIIVHSLMVGFDVRRRHKWRDVNEGTILED